MVTTLKGGVVVPELSDGFLCLGGVWVVVVPPPSPKHDLHRFSSGTVYRKKGVVVGWLS